MPHPKGYSNRSAMGYRQLLLKYMALVMDCESISFLSHYPPAGIKYVPERCRISEREMELLKQTEAEIRSIYDQMTGDEPVS